MEFKMEFSLPADVGLIIELIEQSGFECYAVGGCVRDLLLGISPNDWDFTTNALPHDILNIFSDYDTFDAGIKHGTISVVINKKVYEITTFRYDGKYTDNRHPQNVTFTTNIKDDLARRDFTINAMAYNPRDGIIDIFNGQTDLKYKAIRCVGNPDTRFNEDALRMLRALRFASTYKFTIENSTACSIFKNRHFLSNISAQRIADELTKLLCGDNVDYILRRFKEVFAVIIPEIEVMFDFNQNNPHHNKTLWRHVVSSVKHIENTPVLRMTMLLHDIGKPQTKSTDSKGISHFNGHPMLSVAMADVILKRLKFSNEFISNVLTLIKHHDERFFDNERFIKRTLQKIGEEQFKQLLKVQKADMMAQSFYKREEKEKNLMLTKKVFEKILKNQECFSLKQLQISGRDLIDMGIENGIQIGQTLQKLLDMVINGEVPNEKGYLIIKAKLINRM